MIKSSDLTIVVQGKMFGSSHGSTLDVLRSARRYFAGCELILSTWETETVCSSATALCDYIIQSKDPGDYTDPNDTPININRQIVSSREGVLRASRPFVIKTRTDLIFTSGRILDALNREHSSSKLHKSKKRLIAANFSTRSHLKGLKVPFWVCDFIYAGSKEALEKMFSVPLMEKKNFVYYKNQSHPSSYSDKCHLYRYSPESYLTYNYLGARENVKFEHSYDNDRSTLAAYEAELLKEFLIMNKWELGVDSLKYYLPFNSHHIMLSSFNFKSLLREKNNEMIRYEISDFVELLVSTINRMLRRRFR